MSLLKKESLIRILSSLISSVTWRMALPYVTISLLEENTVSL